MEIQRTKSVIIQPDADTFQGINFTNDLQERLNLILAANAELDSEKVLFPNQSEKVEAQMMRHPIQSVDTFSYFGFLLGFFPPSALFLKFLYQSGRIEPGIFFLLLFVVIICSAVGYFSGKIVGKIVRELENLSWNMMLIILPFIGVIWGIVTGGAGGIFIFVIGAIFGSIIAAVVGGIALPAFTIFHRLLRKGDVMERNQFLPIAFGITFIISAFILGL